MRNLFPLALLIIIFSGCDPTAFYEADIENLTTQTLTIDFISAEEELSKSLLIQPNQTVFFKEGDDFGNTFVQPLMAIYDSVVVKNQTDVILRVYKENDTGRNIYNIDDYWTVNKPKKRVFKYKYVILNEDIE
ncbi:hypothetical protein IQ255_29635 [Pleurocapsales cyanobacterium LEGE 10410]|nr:hypothetical protein [Pleurocapsales cyanobacterium LEGE 10410]